MTEPIPFPASPYCRVRARVASIWADGPDDGTHPDWRPAAGEKITLTPSIGNRLLTYDATGPEPIIVTVERVECVVDEDGWLAKADGRPVFIAPTDDPLLSVTGWTWTASIKGKTVAFAAPSGGVVDLALFIAAPATDDTKSWVERIPELIDAAGSLVGIASVTSDAGDMVVTLTNGEAHRFPLPEGVPGEKGDPGDKGDWADTTVIEAGAHLDDVTTPGTYLVAGTYPESTTALGYPVDGFSGTVEVYGRPAGTAGLRQVASGRNFDQQHAAFGRVQFQRTRYNDVWSSWVDMNLDGSVFSRQIFAPGRPDIPATTPYTQADLNSVPSGHRYISLDGPQGAWEWQKRGTRWVVTSGDTGVRRLDITDTWPEYSERTKLLIRRIGETVTVVPNNIIWQEDVASTGASAYKIYTPGFVPESAVFAEIYDSYSTDLGTKIGVAMASLDMSALQISLRHDATRSLSFELRWDTFTPWPHALPGTPG